MSQQRAHINLPCQKRRRPEDTHLHYGAQQVGTPEVDPIFEGIVPFKEDILQKQDLNAVLLFFGEILMRR